MEKEAPTKMMEDALKDRLTGHRLPTDQEVECLQKDSEAFIQRCQELKRKERRAFDSDRQWIPLRTVAVIAGTMGFYRFAEYVKDRTIKDLPPEKAIWGTRALENVHAVGVVVNMIRGILSKGNMHAFEHIYNMEIGYYLYEMGKVDGLDKLHHIVSAAGYAGLIVNAYNNDDIQRSRRVKFLHALVAVCIHVAEPLKDFSRYLALYPSLKYASRAVWILHHILYTLRILEYPILFYGRTLVNPELRGQIFKGVPIKCVVFSTILSVLNVIWLYRKLAKFAFPA